MNIKYFKNVIDTHNRMSDVLRQMCKEYCRDKSIDVFDRWEFFCIYAIQDEPKADVYKNKVLSGIQISSTQSLHDSMYRSYPKYFTVDCVSVFRNFVNDLDVLPHYDHLFVNFWRHVGKYFGERRFYETFDCDIEITIEQFKQMLEQQMQDYVHTFIMDW